MNEPEKFTGQFASEFRDEMFGNQISELRDAVRTLRRVAADAASVIECYERTKQWHFSFRRVAEDLRAALEATKEFAESC